MRKGVALVEMIIVFALLAIILPGLAMGFGTVYRSKPQINNRIGAVYLLKEAQEALRTIREAAWSQISTNGTYKIVQSGSSWVLQPGAETTGIYTRGIIISNVNRNTSGDIVTSGGSLDPSTKRVVTTVSWNIPTSSSISATTYFTRHLSNNVWVQTSAANFNAGSFTNTSINSDSVILSPVPGNDWATPTLAATYNDSGTIAATHVTTDGNYAYLGKAGNPSVVVIDISNPLSPTLTSSLILTGNANDIVVSGNMLYVAGSNNSRELSVVDATNKSSLVNTGNGNLAGNSDGLSVDYESNYAYVGRTGSVGGDKEFGIINVTNPAAPTVSAELEVSGASAASIRALQANGNYVFVGTSDGANELKVINVTNKSAPTVAYSYNLPGTAQINSLYLSGTFLYVGTNNNTSGVEFYVLNVSNPLSISTSGSYEIGANVNEVSYSSNTAFLATSLATRSFWALNVSTPSSITTKGFLALTGTSNGITAFGNYAYVSSTDTAGEMKVIGGGGAGGYETSGTFTSQTFDAGANVGFNSIFLNYIKPSGTDITFQVATNSDNSTWNYYGPDGTGSTNFTSNSPINLNQVSARYLRVRASLSGDGTVTPSLDDFTVNYSL